MRAIEIKNKKIGDGYPTFVIAEMACSHHGDVDRALELVDIAAGSGADAVQLQIFSVKDYITPQQPAYDLVKSLELPPEQWVKVMEKAKKYAIALFVAAYDHPSVDLAIANGVDAFKIHSSDLSNPYLTKYIAAKGKPVTLGTGASTAQEIEEGIRFLTGAGCAGIMLMHGYQNFPTNIEEVNLKFISYLKEKYGLPVGYQDHTDGDDPLAMILPMMSLGFGVNVLEKHFNLNRKDKLVDYQSALDPDELKGFIANLRRLEKAIGEKDPRPFTEAELKYRTSGKKSIVASRSIKSGQAIKIDDLLFMRSLPGLPPTEADKILGRKVKREMKRLENISLEDVE